MSQRPALASSRPFRLALAVMAALALVATSCGDDEPAERADTVEESSSTTAPAGTEDDSDDGDDGGGGGEPREDESAIEAELEAKLVAVADLPTGWTGGADGDDDGADEDDGDDGDGDGDESEMAEDCGFEGDILPDDVEPLAEVEREFEKSDLGPFLFVSLTRFAEGEGATAIDALETMLQQCRDFSSSGTDGAGTKGTMQPLSFPSHGDETFAARLEFEAEGVTGQGDVVAVRTGDEVVLMMGLSMATFLGGAPFAQDEYHQIVGTAVEKAFG
jgi:hypothetical protein